MKMIDLVAAPDKVWDSATLAINKQWKEMDEFLARCETEGPPRTTEEAEKRRTKIKAIQTSITQLGLEILKRTSSGDVAPHLKPVEGEK